MRVVVKGGGGVTPPFALQHIHVASPTDQQILHAQQQTHNTTLLARRYLSPSLLALLFRTYVFIQRVNVFSWMRIHASCPFSSAMVFGGVWVKRTAEGGEWGNCVRHTHAEMRGWGTTHFEEGRAKKAGAAEISDQVGGAPCGVLRRVWKR